MTQFEFSFIIDGFDPRNEKQMTALCENFPETTASGWQDKTLLEFVASGTNALSTLRKTRKAIEQLIPGSRVISLGEDLLGIPEIASRTDRSEESIRQLVHGLRGSGDFPSARGILKGGARVWRWEDVAVWLHEHGILIDLDTEFIDRSSAAWFELDLVGESPQSPTRTPKSSSRQTLDQRKFNASTAGSRWKIDVSKKSTARILVGKGAQAKQAELSKKPRR
jgi:hypothetical protein